MKKTLAVIVISVMIFAAISVSAFAADGPVTFKFADMGYENAQKVETINKDGVKMELSLGTNDKDNYPAYYDKGAALRIYKNNTFTVTSDTAFTSIKFSFIEEYAANYVPSTGECKLDGLTCTWTGNAKSITFENPDHATRLPEITFLYSGSSVPETPSYNTPEEIVNALYALGNNEKLAGGPYTLTGKIIAVNTPYNTQYGNITVTIDAGVKDKPVQCFRLEGEGADKLDEGDTIKVEGELKNYYNSNSGTNTFEFDAKCKLLEYTKGEVTTPDPVYNTDEELLKAAYGLQTNTALKGRHTLTGTITEVNTAYNGQYNNVTVTIKVEGLEQYPIQCYRLTDGEGVTVVGKLGVGDKITVTGAIKNYNGTVEYDAGCTVDSYTLTDKPDDTPDDTPTTTAEILEAVYALGENESLKGVYTLTGDVVSVDTPYSAEFKNVTVTIKVPGFDDKPIMCYRLGGDGADRIEVGDCITVTGSFKNYNGTREFNAGCELDELIKGDEPVNPGTSDASIAVAAFALVASAVIIFTVGKKRSTVR